MITVFAENLCFSTTINNFSEFILWLAMLALIGSAISGAYLRSFSQGFIYKTEFSDQNDGFKKFSLTQLQLPFTSKLLTESLTQMDIKTSFLVRKAIKADFIFMPFFYGMIFLLQVYSLTVLNSNEDFDKTIKSILYITVLSYLADSLENHLTFSLLKKMEELKMEKMISSEDRKFNELEKTKLITYHRIPILISSLIKWITVILSCTVTLAALWKIFLLEKSVFLSQLPNFLQSYFL